MSLASANCAVIVTAVPATGDVLLVDTRYFAAGPATVVTFPLVPVRLLASVAVNVYVTLATVFVVNDTVATPFASVDDVGVANEPAAPVLLHVTSTPGREMGLPLASTSRAVIVTGAPATTLDALVVTMYFAAGPGTVVTVVDPVTLPVAAVIVCDVPTTVLVVNATVAMPLAFVVVDDEAKDPPFVLLHVTVWPGNAIALPPASTTCAEIVTVAPAAGLPLLDVTT